MTRILIASRGDLEPIAALFRAELPSHEVLTEPPIPDVPIPYLVAGRPAPGVIAGVARVELVLSLNAGIEHLLAGGEVPREVPIIHLVDEGLSEGMADWVLGHALSWHRNLGLYRAQQERGVWLQQPEKLARERLVTVLGAGAIGGPIAAHFVRFGFETRVWSRSGRPVEGATSFAGRSQLLEAVRDADIVVDLLPMTAETENLVDAALFSAMRRGGFFINGGRGGHVVDADLIAALDQGQLSGAALDVFRIEPLPESHPFWRHPKVIVSPHVAAPTHPQTAVKVIAETIRRHERGEPLAHVVDRALGY